MGLIENLTEIKRQKTEYIKPEYIKEGIEVFGITGTLATKGNLQTKAVTITENGTMTITPDEGFDGIVSLDADINVIDEEYPGNLEIAKDILDSDMTIPYIRLDYISSTSAHTQWIDTGIHAGVYCDVEMKINAVNSGETYQSIFGADNGGTSYRGFGVDIQTNGRTGYLYDDIAYTSAIIPDSKKYGNDVIIQSNGATCRFICGENTYTATASSYNKSLYVPKSMYLFARNRDNYNICNSEFKLYYCKLWVNKTLVRDFIPVQRKSDNAICLYDKVTNAFFVNKGSGQFEAGPVRK